MLNLSEYFLWKIAGMRRSAAESVVRYQSVI